MDDLLHKALAFVHNLCNNIITDSKKQEIKNAVAKLSFKSRNLHTFTSVRLLKRKNDEKSRFREKSLRACEYLL